ncbi:hypothetical protein HDU78_010550 [Chytriomyces hyalinus]|nr:hypothetical protein HDU78_010550 [Chytriomyces hyalinus]
MAALQSQHTDEMSALKAALKLQHMDVMSSLKSELGAVKSELARVVADRETQCMESALRAELATLKPEHAHPVSPETRQMHHISALRAEVNALRCELAQVSAMRSEFDSLKSMWSTIRGAKTDVPNILPNLPSAPTGPVETKE